MWGRPGLTARWHTSTWSNGAECVEARSAGRHVQVRDSTDRSGPVLVFGRPVWRGFCRAVGGTAQV